MLKFSNDLQIFRDFYNINNEHLVDKYLSFLSLISELVQNFSI